MDLENSSILHYAIRGEHLEVVKFIIDHQLVDLNKPNSLGFNPLMESIKVSNP